VRQAGVVLRAAVPARVLRRGRAADGPAALEAGGGPDTPTAPER
jgi:hypothetical protein